MLQKPILREDRLRRVPTGFSSGRPPAGAPGLLHAGGGACIESDFNIGLRTLSAKIPTVEMKIVFKHENAIEGNFVKL